ncbi:COG4705 family protein [Aurantimonas sp. A3-2-R12]|uniref:COG4705 family protein n=1 Tax=Aurantimonas sp. A3-2-R12 TaxID=3114362 RepID=UPI003FA48427
METQRSLTREMLNKVPAVTLAFWVIKIMATTVGETAADFLIFNIGLGLVMTSLIMGALLLIALFCQLRLREYVPTSYWLVVVLVSIVGTLVSDYLVDDLGITLATTTILFGTGLALVFAAWYASERTLSIHSIFTTKRELFYWAAILFTFALGTSAGDLVAESVGLGYGTSAVIFGALIAVVYLGHRLGVGAVLAFWVAYILTRPFGASMGDLLSQPVGNGGFGLGTTGTSVLFLVTIAGLVTYLTITRADRIKTSQVVEVDA